MLTVRASRGRWATLLTAVLFVVAVPNALGRGATDQAPLIAQPAGPDGAGSAMPVLLAPQGLGLPNDPDALADAWLAATSDREREALLLSVLEAMGVGVYTSDGAPILIGAERSADDPWLTDAEVGLLAADPGQVLLTSLADRAALLAALVTDAAGEPLSAQDLADAVAEGLADAVVDPSDPAGLALRLAHALVLRESGVDLSDGVPADLPVGSLASALLAWDLLWPLMTGRGVALAVAAADVPLVHGRPGAPAGPRTAQACDGIGAEGRGATWGIGMSGARGAMRGARTTGASSPADLLRVLSLSYALRVRPQAAPGAQEIHHQHPSESGIVFLIPFAVDVSLIADLAPEAAGCATLQGVEQPRLGPVSGAMVTWNPGALADHGSVRCDAGCPATGADGRSSVSFFPTTELKPAGLGPEKQDSGVMTAHVEHSLRLRGAPGAVTLAGSTRFPATLVSWHRDHTFALIVWSKITGTQVQRFTSIAQGVIEFEGSPVFAGEPLGSGELGTDTKPGRADGCKGQTSVKGRGPIDFDVVALMIDQTTKSIVVGVDTGSDENHPDTVTYKGCGPVKRWTKRASVWEQHFMFSHVNDRGPTPGLLLRGWTWKATDETWERGGIVATLDLRETCQRMCKGTSQFELHAFPFDE